MNIQSIIFENLINFIELNYFFSILIFFIFIFLYSCFSLPGLLIFVVFSGYCFGIYLGYFVSILSITLGSFCFFLLSKFFLSKLFFKFYNKYTKKINSYIKNSSLEYLIIFRMIPGPPLMIQNVIMSILNIKSRVFIISTLIGFTPIIIFSVLLGNKIKNINSFSNMNIKELFTLDFFALILLIILFLLFKIFFKKYVKKALK